MDPIAAAIVDAEFTHAFAHRLYVPRVGHESPSASWTGSDPKIADNVASAMNGLLETWRSGYAAFRSSALTGIPI